MANKKENGLTKSLTFRLDQDDYDQYFKQFESAKIGKKKYTKSDYFRDLLHGTPPPEVTVVKREVVHKRPISQCDRQRLVMLANTTNNINQLARSINTLMKSDRVAAIAMLKQIEIIHAYIKAELC